MHIDTSKIELKNYLLSAKTFVVPPFQRDFSWGKTQIQALFTDIMDIMTSSRPEHFLGSMVFVPIEGEDKDSYTILDGQQRLASMVLLLTALRDSIKEIPEENERKTRLMGKIESSIFPITSMADDEEVRTPRISMNELDNDFFIGILNGKQLQPKYKSNKLMLESYKELRSLIGECLKSYGPWANTANNLIKTIENKLILIEIALDTTENAYKVFETLNNSGADLSIIDLFKNHLFSKSEHGYRIDIAWRTLMDTLKDVNFTKFLRYYYNSHVGFSRKSDLLLNLKEHLKEKSVRVLMDDLKRSAENYIKLVFPKKHSWDSRIPEVPCSLEAIISLGFEQPFMLLLIAYEKLYSSSPREFAALVQAIESFSFKYGTICGRNPNLYEKIYSQFAIEFKEGRLDVSGIIGKLRDDAPSKEQFIAEFMKYEATSSSMIVPKYLLSKIEEYVSSGRGNGKQINWAKVNIEHIIPQKLSEEWKRYLEDKDTIHEQVVSRLGNLTILEKRLNSSISNSLFKDKKPEYEKTDINITKSIGKYSDFSFAEVIARQSDLAALAYEAWKL